MEEIQKKINYSKIKNYLLVIFLIVIIYQNNVLTLDTSYENTICVKLNILDETIDNTIE